MRCDMVLPPFLHIPTLLRMRTTTEQSRLSQGLGRVGCASGCLELHLAAAERQALQKQGPCRLLAPPKPSLPALYML
jgi:hypothetical protein